MGGVGPRLYCDSPGHAHRTKTCNAGFPLVEFYMGGPGGPPFGPPFTGFCEGGASCRASPHGGGAGGAGTFIHGAPP